MRFTLVAPATLLALAAACSSGEGGFHVGDGADPSVGGQPQMIASADELVFEDVPVASARSLDLVLENHGDADLEVFEVMLLDNVSEVFYLDEHAADGLVVVPGDDAAVTVGCAMSEEGQVAATLRIDSNDGTHPTFDVALLAMTSGWEDTGS